MTDRLIHVSIGEVKIGKGRDILRASLGSCVGIALLWPDRKIYGLAHCLLPEAPQGAGNGIGGRFVTQAIPSLLALMKIREPDYSEIDAVIAGGGNMTAPIGAKTEELIGTLNTKIAETILRGLKIRIVHKEIGGETGRRVDVYCETGTYTVKEIPRILAAGDESRK